MASAAVLAKRKQDSEERIARNADVMRASKLLLGLIEAERDNGWKHTNGR